MIFVFFTVGDLNPARRVGLKHGTAVTKDEGG